MLAALPLVASCGDDDDDPVVKKETVDANGHEYVDLGLPSGLLWATMNIGAAAPENSGYYFAWGETKTKSKYNWYTYEHCEGDQHSLTKYNEYADYGTVDNKAVLELSDDAAHVVWGGDWRMPTIGEWQELLDNCMIEWVEDYKGNGVSGRLVTSSANGNTLFLPAAGYRSDSEYKGVGILGYYSSSSVGLGHGGADNMYFESSRMLDMSVYRYVGQSVRAVLDAE